MISTAPIHPPPPHRYLKRQDPHCSIHILHGHLAVDLPHSRAGIFHGGEGLLIDVCGFDGVDLLLEHGDLAVGLFEGVLVLLLAFEGVASS